MPFIDPEQLEQGHAKLSEWADQPGQAGVSARLCLATLGVDQWIASEYARGTDEAEMVIAVVQRAASMVATQVLNLGPADQIGTARDTVLGLLNSTILQTVARFDAMPPSERAKNTVTLNPGNMN